MSDAPSLPPSLRLASPTWSLYAAGFTTAFGAHGIAANLAVSSDGVVDSLLTLGVLLALYDGAEVLRKPVFGTLADRIGARPVLLRGLVAFAVASAVFGVAVLPLGLSAAEPVHRPSNGAAPSAPTAPSRASATPWAPCWVG